ncbi:hypothetical protein BCR33DRAFT_715358 [Rhizoclosmatium globosum]|uniref:tRNA pseudouridine(55) synthase n=1 Tax=Rhizoclosmatium globosum TaxID=329046 RepID=A0A1Y2CIV5_9FUNG|nr:hypothetical protein BCR33DRAFT_715358 [Rhizoclosmatium globosum]|eukprot:ORY46970.1 hypothetical protein BCR33DRAFT_715358 [Rhizoclosmatium globosum]
MLSTLITPFILSQLPSQAPQVATLLQSHGACSLCVLRVLCVRKVSLFVASTASASATSTCPLCLGLLSRPSISAAVSKAADLFSTSATRGAANFVVAVRVPVQLALRARAADLIIDHAGLGAEIRKVAERDPKRFDLENPDPSQLDALAKDKQTILTDPHDNLPFSITQSQIEVKEVLRFIMAHEFAQASNLAFLPSSELQLELGFDHPPTGDEFEWMQSIEKCGLTVRKKRKRVREGSVWRKMKDDEPKSIRIEGATWNHIVNAANALSYQEFVDHGYLPTKFREVSSPCDLSDLKFLHKSLWVAGRYNKYSRGVSNSRMEFKGERLAAESVEELIAASLDPFFHADNHKFASAGREDVDVLMLGSGRPFYMEIVNPRVLDATQEEITEVQSKINESNAGKIKITDLQLIPKNDTKPLKDSAATKRKSYSTLVRLSKGVRMAQLEEISKLKDLELKQQTPVRVMQSRSDKERDKIVHELKVYPENEGSLGEDGERLYDLIRVDLTTSAGTYVKEFCHSDGGRTVPSIKELLGVDSAVVETLDVLHVFLDWPKPVV